jgi:hypothetical protein
MSQPPVSSVPAVATAPAVTDSPHRDHRHRDVPDGHSVLEISDVKGTLLRAGRLFLEAGIIPSALLIVLLNVVGLFASVAVAIGWVLLATCLRWLFSRELPGTLLLCVMMLTGRMLVALATGSAFIYMLQPILGSGLMAALFLGSAALGRPVTLRLARDFLTIPAHITDRHDVRRMFSQVALVWGVSRLLDALLSVGSLQLGGIQGGLMARGVLSPTLTVLTVVVSAAWGWRSLHRNGIHLRLVPGTPSQ